MFKNLKLNEPIVFFDLETTGIAVESARIVEFAWIRIDPDGVTTGKSVRVNPRIPIPLSASSIHGIYDKDVKDEPSFFDAFCCHAHPISEYRLGGFNVANYDIPILTRELLRYGENYDDEGRDPLDVMQILHRLVPWGRNLPRRTLSWGYEQFVSEPLEGAHGAMSDVNASVRLLDALIARFDLPDTVDGLISRFPVERKY